MAKKVTKKVTKKRVKKNVERGQAQMHREMLDHGQVLVVLVLEVQENLLHTQLRWQLKQQLKQLCRMVLNQ